MSETAGRKIFRRWGVLGFEFVSDMIAHDYMRRWILRTPWGALRLHKIMRGDSREHFHDHPFSFVSLILKGGYVENRPGCDPRWYFPGELVFRRALDLHYLDLIEDAAWTLVLAGPEHRRWGFATEEGWVDAAEYDTWLERRSEKRAEAAAGEMMGIVRIPSCDEAACANPAVAIDYDASMPTPRCAEHRVTRN